ncbi:MAG: hypothetical protein QW685_05220 [Saccharolobus sp.]
MRIEKIIIMSSKRKYYTIQKTLRCQSGYGIYECDENDKCTLIACTYVSNLATPLNI